MRNPRNSRSHVRTAREAVFFTSEKGFDPRRSAVGLSEGRSSHNQANRASRKVVFALRFAQMSCYLLLIVKFRRDRSEERRVGKECRCSRSSYHEKKNI